MTQDVTEAARVNQWVDFKELRDRLDFPAVLAHYGVTLKPSGEQAIGLCPLPDHPKHHGKKRTASFSANLRLGIWHCFGCGAKGTVFDFAIRLDGGSPANPVDVRRTALAWKHRLRLGAHSARVSQPAVTGRSFPVIVNAPLDFALSLNARHAYLTRRGLTSATIAHFGLGYCGRGMLNGRIAIPLQDSSGRLIGYAGRLVDDAAVTDAIPKYRFPGSRTRKGVTFAFRKSQFLYNGHSVPSPVSDLVVVEGFPSVWWLWQAGHHHVVAVMGSSVSEVQANLIIKTVAPDGRIWLMPDGDDAGERWVREAFLRLGPHRFVRWVRLKRDQQPTDLKASELAESFQLKNE